MSSPTRPLASPEVVATPDGYDAVVAALFARRPERMVPGLRRIRSLCCGLGDPQHAYAAVHITGTNGKTSMARMVTALLVEAGRRVGTYTSPHLQDVRERIRIDGLPVSRTAFLRVFDDLDAQISRTEHELGESVTFFEALTAMGALCFQDAGVDVGVIEVGMGGRWDATNVHDAQVAVIGTVGLDHPELGSTVAEVAGEKAGIIKELAGGAAVAVVAPQRPEADRVIAAEVTARGARLRHAGRDFDVLSRRPVAGGQDLVLRVGSSVYDVHVPLHGRHQAINAVCALAAVDALVADAGGLCPDAVRAGFARVRSPGRLELFERPGRAPVVLDGAHNPDGARALAEALREAFPGRRLVAVLGVLGDKDVDGVVGAVLEVADEAVVTPSPCGRTAPVDQLASAVLRRGRPVSVASTVEEAIARAETAAGSDDVIVVTGSLYLVGAARDALGAAVG